MMFPLGSNSAFSFLPARLLAPARDCDGLTAMSHPNVFNSDDPETVQIFTSIHEEDLFSVCRNTVCCQVQIQILFIHDW